MQGLGLLSLTSYLFLLKPEGCGNKDLSCSPQSSYQTSLFYLSIYLIALGYGGYQPNIATFGADQFDALHPQEGHSKIAFFSYFYLALNLGSLFSNTILAYFENEAIWSMGFWASTGSAALGLILFLFGTPRYRYFRVSGNPFPRVCQVFVAAGRKWKFKMDSRVTSGDDEENNLYEVDEENSANVGGRKKIPHTQGLRYIYTRCGVSIYCSQLRSIHIMTLLCQS